MRISTTMERTIKQLAAKHSIDLSRSQTYLKLYQGFYMPLLIYAQEENKLSVMHLNSEQRADPEIVFWTASSAGWVAIEITQLISGHHVYAEVSEDGTTLTELDINRQATLTSFAEMWARNLIAQEWLEHGKKSQERFPMGRIVATQGVLWLFAEAELSPDPFLDRHVVGDWGDLDAHDLVENERALERGGRLMSVYPLPDGDKLWIITEWDRSVTTLLLPEEY